jgi:hypothetical protein
MDGDQVVRSCSTWSKTLDAFFDDLRPDRSADIKVVSMDMGPAYVEQRSIRAGCPTFMPGEPDCLGLLVMLDRGLPPQSGGGWPTRVAGAPAPISADVPACAPLHEGVASGVLRVEAERRVLPVGSESRPELVNQLGSLRRRQPDVPFLPLGHGGTGEVAGTDIGRVVASWSTAHGGWSKRPAWTQRPTATPSRNAG